MKHLLSILLLLLAVPCNAQHQYEISYQSETEETIQLSVIVYGVKEKQARESACLCAMQSLIFDGIKGSKRRYIPYVQDKQSSYNEHAAFYYSFFDKGEYLSYVIAASIMEKGKTQDKQKYYLVNVNINFKALKDCLSYHNVIRRFGV